MPTKPKTNNPVADIPFQSFMGAGGGMQQMFQQPTPTPAWPGMPMPWGGGGENWAAKGQAIQDILRTQAQLKRQAQNSPQDDWKAGMWASVPNSLASGTSGVKADESYKWQPGEAPEAFAARIGPAAQRAAAMYPSPQRMTEPGLPFVTPKGQIGNRSGFNGDVFGPDKSSYVPQSRPTDGWVFPMVDLRSQLDAGLAPYQPGNPGPQPKKQATPVRSPWPQFSGKFAF